MTSAQLDRAIGAVLGSAAGDALGSQYEFGSALADTVTPVFGRGYFGHDVGEWTDDTSMAVPILDAVAAGESLSDPQTREKIVARWTTWSRTAKDVGAQTRSVFTAIPEVFTEADVRQAAQHLHERTGRSGGNGALMRTGPLVLGYLDASDAELADAARAVSELTHWEADSASACILWCVATRHSIRTGELDIARGLALLDAAEATRWRALIDEALAPGAHPRDFAAQNGWVVRAFQGALAAIVGATSLVDALERAVRGGNDTDTVAAIAGSLAGAVWGASALPTEWLTQLHGWPGYSADDLIRQVTLAVNRDGERSD